MKIRRVLATAVALAVTTPAALLSVSPAYADAKPAAQTQEKQSKPTIEELEEAAAEAQKAYDKAAEAKAAGYAELEKTLGDLTEAGGTHPLAVASAAAKQAAKDAAAAKTAADQAVTDAQAALDALPEDATEEEKAAATTALSEAKTTAATAATTKTAADTAAAEAGEKLTDARIAAARAYGVLVKAAEDALAVKVAADAALAKAIKEAEEGEGEEGGDCEPELDLTSKVTGLPDKLVAGTSTDFSLRVTNGSDRHMDKVLAFVSIHATDTSGLKDTEKFFRLQWSTKSAPKWQNADADDYIDGVGALKPGAHTDVKLRLTLDKATPAGNGVAFFAADFFNEDGSCGGAPDLDMYEFDVKAAGSKPGKTEDVKPSTTPRPGNTGTTPQGSASGTPASTGTNGSLAATGSSSATTPIALAGGAAVLLGAAAVFVARRRKTGSDA
ncbi:LPXTG cell wall anchor domain-containing protein [Streptomyces sp. MBT67]|uniref:LAETG motif-containing sortase-dependent surface protein n=1 Tax=unclassified Streptomyces TaxID=2593676 RepID=UPI00190A0FD3|nr:MULTISPECIES: LAETG motif-containing sortase-dependent surface protein [unclassified Streptomyces]MBK3533273.1 LPXTG cell wall anchor domain-containing protein [Streptomyces sp. MBT72]MBK3540042.1 LPXTG cell wall anchor domain-containing protein [Streptomyces sp. MBT67]MBK3554274.1 LPXTG cell wall anchor domain-containing protein [Streptomyces sp. MBT61]MBK6033064.1 LPXTG cell wall anchor domain-containing protein [Streptomyces sp. MBT59]